MCLHLRLKVVFLGTTAERGLRKITKVADRVRIITSDFRLISCVAAPAAAVENVWSSTEIKYKAGGELEI